MPNTLILTLLPNGVDRDTGRLRLSVVAGFQLDGPVNKFEGSPVAKWPTLAADLGFGVLVSGTDEPVPATRTGERPDQRLWDALFPPRRAARQATDRRMPPAYESLRTPYSYADKHDAATALYAEAMATSPTAPLRRDHAVALAIAALAELTDGGAGDAARRANGAEPVPPSVRQLLDPDRLTPDRLDAAVAELTRRPAGRRRHGSPRSRPTVMRHRRRIAAAAGSCHRAATRRRPIGRPGRCPAGARPAARPPGAGPPARPRARPRGRPLGGARRGSRRCASTWPRAHASVRSSMSCARPPAGCASTPAAGCS